MAYESNDSGQFEIFVRRFPDVDSGRWQVSTQGGIQPLWSRNGQELFYIMPGGGLMSVRVDAKVSWSAAAPVRVLDEHYYHTGGGTGAGRTYDVSPDGRRFLMIKPVDPAGTPPGLVMVQNWREELARLMK
jgi:serine/threonine-protein kinase